MLGSGLRGCELMSSVEMCMSTETPAVRAAATNASAFASSAGWSMVFHSRKNRVFLSLSAFQLASVNILGL